VQLAFDFMWPLCPEFGSPTETLPLQGPGLDYGRFKKAAAAWRDGRVAEGARLESVFRGNSNVGSNPTLSAIMESITYNKMEILQCNSVQSIL
jgi:hypothetical protein